MKLKKDNKKFLVQTLLAEDLFEFVVASAEAEGLSRGTWLRRLVMEAKGRKK